MNSVYAHGDFFRGAQECANPHAVLEGKMNTKVAVFNAGLVEVGEAYAKFEIRVKLPVFFEGITNHRSNGIDINGAIMGSIDVKMRKSTIKIDIKLTPEKGLGVVVQHKLIAMKISRLGGVNGDG